MPMCAQDGNTYGIFQNPTYVVLCLNEQMTTYTGFAYDTNHYALNLVSATWVLYSPTSELVSSGGTCLGSTT